MSQRKVVYYRPSLMEDEVYYAELFFDLCTSYISDIGPGDFVIPRYTTLPFAVDFYNELTHNNAECINSFHQHKFMADVFQWSEVLGDLTPRSWHSYELHRLPSDKWYVLKGQTNSKKHYWNTHMLAKSKADAIRIHGLLCEDGLLGTQEIVIREYIPLHTYMLGINDLPITNEHRVFYYKGEVLCSGFYWQNYATDLDGDQWNHAHEFRPPKELLEDVGKRLAEHTNFSVVDFGQKEDGSWTVIEVNDATMSGLSCINPEDLYSRLQEVLY